jgi:DNA-binding IclR family transcriptional regulator
MADFVTIAEAAKHLDMSERTVQRMVEAGTLVGYVAWDEVRAKLRCGPATSEFRG